MWVQDSKKKLLVKESLKEASAFRKTLREKGVTGDIHLISRARAYPPQEKSGPRPKGHLWCPYCVRYRVFRRMTVKRKDFDYADDETVCTICLIPIENYHVRLHNGMLEKADMKRLVE